LRVEYQGFKLTQLSSLNVAARMIGVTQTEVANNTANAPFRFKKFLFIPVLGYWFRS